MVERLEAFADFLVELPNRWRLGWPLAMFLLGAGAFVAALLFNPGADEWTYFFGRRFGGGCGFLEATGLPCPSCGMTRSWVWLARGHVFKALSYNPAGALLLGSLMWMGVVGAVRLITRDPKKLTHPIQLVGGLLIVWLVVPYLGLWVLRLAGFNPLVNPM